MNIQNLIDQMEELKAAGETEVAILQYTKPMAEGEHGLN